MHIETRLLEKNKIRVNDTGFKIAHLTDIHLEKMFVSKKKIKRAIEEEKPDIIVLTGDYFESKSSSERFCDFLKYINDDSIDVCITWGNHDHKNFKDKKFYKEFCESLNRMGITILCNNSFSVEKNNQFLSIIGIDDLFSGIPDIEKSFSQMPKTSKVCKKIVISHNPDIIFKLKNKEFDMLLAGHFHGGQIYMPFGFEFKILREERLCKMNVIRGLNDVEGHKIYINRGVGNVLFPLRFCSLPEIAFIEI
jgi:predicted MPP superfamily phosphohydrolase